MKLKITSLIALTLIVISCATKNKVSSTETTQTVLSNELLEGKNLYEKNCAECHKLYNPKEFTSEKWKPILTEMQIKAKLNDSQMASISNYINSQL
jgi:cytochrome c553